ncbi:MAG TPA: alpha/beta fold hydrolase [Acidimicrobiales bacterium]|nr:alpha/beta fold hydrolase [Acidimicrobiales bacterium]
MASIALALVLVSGAATATATATGAGAGAGAAAAGSTAASNGGIAWSPCPAVSGYLCGTLQVPLDYGHPSRGTVPLAVMEHPASQSKGVIVFNPGGPGESGVLILPILASLVPEAVKDQFTLVSFDERGTGSSEPLLCGPSAAAASSAVAGTAGATRTFAALEHSCQAKFPALFPTANTTTSARDMDRLRAALAVKTIDFYGMSYGTALGSVYAQMFPSHVRAVVLDGAVDANLSLASDAEADAPAIETALTHELQSCADACPLGADPVGFYKKLQQQLTRAPLPAPGGGDTAPVTVGDLYTATLLYLSAPTFTPGYFPALVAAAAGNGAPLRSVALGLENDLNGESLVGPLWTITCSDVVAHPGATTTAKLARTLAKRYPLAGAEAVANYLIACPGWGSSHEPIAHLSPHGAPTPLVIGNVYDPNTPYVVAPQLAAATGGRLVTYVGYGHTWLLNGSTNTCMQNVVTSYIVDGVVPAKGTRCSATP